MANRRAIPDWVRGYVLVIDLKARPALLVLWGQVVQVAVEGRDASDNRGLWNFRIVLAQVVGKAEVQEPDSVLPWLVFIVVRLVRQSKIDAEVAHANL